MDTSKGCASGSTRRRSTRAAAGPLLPTAADWLFRRPGRRARHCMADGRFLCPARVSRSGVARGAARSLDDFPNAPPDRPRDTRGGLHVDTAAPRGCGLSEGRTVGIDATTLEANAALRSAVAAL